MKNICIIGATGSVGTQALNVIKKEDESFKLLAFSANKSYDKIIKIIEDFTPDYCAIADSITYDKVKNYCSLNFKKTTILKGMEGINHLVQLQDVDLVITSIVGMIGLEPTLKAIEAGKDIALANKETLVTGGSIVMEAAKKNNVNILPVDSEHSAILQCLKGNSYSEVDKIIVTASGGPFRGMKKEELIDITPEKAIKHPKWNMGKKISIDSSTLMNKGLEVIEAKWLFDVSYDQIQVLVHPQSIIHSMVQYIDGSVIAQLSTPNMELPIQYAMNYPKRKSKVIDTLNFYELGKLTFEKPDINTFECLALAYEAGRVGGIIPTVLNASNEVAVQLFLDKKISYLQITDIIKDCLNKFENINSINLETILETEKMVTNYILNNLK
ncbi:1-deoxy-D-xylulose-5-phosphate reductoisomerase [Clostridium sediminicola]|uniref:1-deoxy-D-xylulose-5-phosphate reductoisomerase n=1 Tax=Clostridium sediminicola TaxID=3114879 RepID=UPI0031F2671D